MTLPADMEARELVQRMRDPATLTPAVVDQYDTLCIPFYRELLGNHWHTGYYLSDDQPTGPRDQLRMERCIGLSSLDTARYIHPIHETWAIRKLGTRMGYASAMAAADLVVKDAVDLRDEMPLLRGFLVDEADRDDVRREQDSTSDPIRKTILEGLLRLGEVAGAGAFTLGRFLAIKE